MSKGVEQVLTIEPANELRFKGPFNEVVTADLKLTNSSDRRVCFKVKTTAPKRYCVRPNSGIIEPKGLVNVSVMLQPFEYDPTEKNKHKFMVQTMFPPEGKIDNQEQLWKEITPDQLMDSKLKCVFEMPETRESSVPLNSAVQEEKVHAMSVKQEFAQTRSGLASTPPKTSSGSEPERRQTDEAVRQLQQQVAKLKQENSSLKAEEVRLRKVAISDTVTSTPQPTHVIETSGPAVALPSYVFLIIALILGIIIGKLIL